MNNLEKRPGKTENANPAEAAERRRQSQKSLIRYGAVLLIVAFLLVLISYLAQLRAARDELSTARQEQSAFSISAMKTVGDLRDENEELTRENDRLSGELEQERATRAEEDAAVAAARTDLEGALAESEKRADALARLRDIVTLFNRGDYAACREQIEAFEAAGLTVYLSTEGGASDYSPYTQYTTVYKSLYN
ncbi:hypothetical protein LJC34_08025 [Oscillospiraceae bacterium OttesenSCG-928-G22]|nr:hypothetical protein [Oscillospiraceae bacterium OttesenSCG-928-G22]